MAGPSFTVWSRLEPRARADDMARSLQAQIRDPLWMLARQWQVGEFLGSDGGSPLQATIATESQPLTSYRPGPPGAAAAGSIDETLPLETHVEREEVHLGLRGRVQIGLRLEAFMGEEGVSQAGIEAFREAYEIDPPAAPGPVPDPEGDRWRALARGRVIDGVKAYEAAKGSLPQLPPNGPVLGQQDEQAALDALTRLVALRESLYTVPDHDSAWVEQQLHHEFAVGSEPGAQAVTLESGAFGGGRLDWYSFELAHGALRAGSAAVDSREWNFIPNHVTLRGMPNPTWWELEDGQTDFGTTDLEKVDLAKLLVMQFALLYGNDWFEIGLPLELGSIASVTLLVVTDTFGTRTLIRPTGASDGAGTPWSLFTTSGAQPERDFLLLPPVLGAVQDGDVLEAVTFLRDEMAAMGWAVEEKVPGQLDTALDRHEAYLQRLAAEPPPPAPVPPGPSDPQIRYLVGTTVPDNWIPLVPVSSRERSFLFRRGVMGQPGAAGPQGELLAPGRPLYLAEEAVPRAGTAASRRFRRARWTDGSTVVWMGRQTRPGRGPGWSGLAFDVVEPNEG